MQIKRSQKKKIPNTSRLIKKTGYSAKITEIEGKIRSISGLATTSVLTAVENKNPSVSSSVRKNKIRIQKLVNLKRKLLLISMTNILLLQNLIS